MKFFAKMGIAAAVVAMMAPSVLFSNTASAASAPKTVAVASAAKMARTVKSKKPAIKCDETKGMVVTKETRRGRIRLVQPVKFTIYLCTQKHPLSNKRFRQVFAAKVVASTGAIRQIRIWVKPNPNDHSTDIVWLEPGKWRLLDDPIRFSAKKCVAVDVELTAYTELFHTGKIKASFGCVR